MRKSSEYVRFNEFTDAISSVQLVATLLELSLRHPIMWKWIVVGAHNGLQAAMVCVLSGTDGTGALTAKSRAAMLEFLQSDKDGPVPDEWLAPFNTLLKWVGEPDRMTDGEPWLPSEKQVAMLHQLNRHRRNFAHYTPKSWSIEASSLPPLIAVALEGIEHLMLKSTRVRVHLTGNQLRALQHSVEKAKSGIVTWIRKAPHQGRA